MKVRAHACPVDYHDEPHYSCYASHRCRCDGCRAEWARYAREHKHYKDHNHALAELRERHREEYDAILARIRYEAAAAKAEGAE